MSSATRTTTIFTKQPRPGFVKTRLCPRLEALAASELALAMLDDTVEKCARNGSFETVLCVDPGHAVAWFEARYPGVSRVVAQVGDGLGARLAHHVDVEFASHASGVVSPTLVVIGSDAPHVPVEACTEAHERLERGADLVLGLDDGGGYHLVALRRPCGELFTRVPMSTNDMGAATVHLARSMGLAVDFVATDFDVDTPGDLDRLGDLLRRGVIAPARLPRTAAFLARSC